MPFLNCNCFFFLGGGGDAGVFGGEVSLHPPSRLNPGHIQAPSSEVVHHISVNKCLV